MDFDAICKYCGEKLPHEKCSEAKKTEPGEFTKKGRAFISQVLNNWGLISVRSWVIEACAEIDRLTTKRDHLLEKVALQEKEIERLTAEERYLNEEVARGIRFYERLEAELKAKDERIEELEKNQFPSEPICEECGKPRKCLGILWENHFKLCKRSK